MADQSVRITDVPGFTAKEEIAYKLFLDVAAAENKTFRGPAVNTTRDWIIRTYCMCQYAVNNPGWVEDALKLGPNP